MARKPSALPKIPVKTERVTKRLQFDPALIKRVEAFCDFYAHTVGAKPDWNDAAVALIEHALDGNRDFTKYLAEQAKPAA
ncbi:hypothetical protein TB9_23050 [Xanthomonas perforans]|uniref:hypothetical protein n=1 Tax=Xanthomonas perforans TaxID=442694 RepID=UPI00062D5DCC|nr:hypothetical protein [Xanthomonas perforans]KLD30051.1 hypothetical protein TB9_23050 [Xanthomonas perforans]